MRITGRAPFSACLRASALALILLTVTGACATTAQQRWVKTKFSACKTITNVSDVTLDHVRPDGQWSAIRRDGGDGENPYRLVPDDEREQMLEDQGFSRDNRHYHRE